MPADMEDAKIAAFEKNFFMVCGRMENAESALFISCELCFYRFIFIYLQNAMSLMYFFAIL